MTRGFATSIFLGFLVPILEKRHHKRQETEAAFKGTYPFEKNPRVWPCIVVLQPSYLGPLDLVRSIFGTYPSRVMARWKLKDLVSILLGSFGKRRKFWRIIFQVETTSWLSLDFKVLQMFTLPTVNSWPGYGHQWLSSLFVNQRKKFNVASILSTTITRDLGEKPCLQVGSAAVGLLHEKGNVTAMLCDAGFEGVDERHLKTTGKKNLWAIMGNMFK